MNFLQMTIKIYLMLKVECVPKALMFSIRNLRYCSLGERILSMKKKKTTQWMRNMFLAAFLRMTSKESEHNWTEMGTRYSKFSSTLNKVRYLLRFEAISSRMRHFQRSLRSLARISMKISLFSGRITSKNSWRCQIISNLTVSSRNERKKVLGSLIN